MPSPWGIHLQLDLDLTHKVKSTASIHHKALGSSSKYSDYRNTKGWNIETCFSILTPLSNVTVGLATKGHLSATHPVHLYTKTGLLPRPPRSSSGTWNYRDPGSTTSAQDDRCARKLAKPARHSRCDSGENATPRPRVLTLCAKWFLSVEFEKATTESVADYNGTLLHGIASHRMEHSLTQTHARTHTHTHTRTHTCTQGRTHTHTWGCACQERDVNSRR